MDADSPDLVIAKRLLDHLKLCGFQFQRAAPGADGPLVGTRTTGDRVDMIHIEGFSRGCFAWRKRTSSLIIPGEALVERRTHGPAVTVLIEVLTWETDAESSETTLQREQVTMARHDQTRDGGRASDEVDPSKIVRPKDGDDGRHTDPDSGSSDDDRDDK